MEIALAANLSEMGRRDVTEDENFNRQRSVRDGVRETFRDPMLALEREGRRENAPPFEKIGKVQEPVKLRYHLLYAIENRERG